MLLQPADRKTPGWQAREYHKPPPVLTRVAQVFSLLTFGKTLAQSALHGVRHHETPSDGRRLRADRRTISRDERNHRFVCPPLLGYRGGRHDFCGASSIDRVSGCPWAVRGGYVPGIDHWWYGKIPRRYGPPRPYWGSGF